MPKVTEEYIIEKKNQIMNAAKDLLQEIPLYQITMRDIIRKINSSQGLIYRYYQNVDEIFIDLMNREIEEIEVKSRFDLCMNNSTNPQKTLHELILILGEYILDVQEKIGGKFYYEIAVTYAFDLKKQRELLPKMAFKQILMYMQSALVRYIAQNTENGCFHMHMSLEDLTVYVGSSIDGIGNHSALTGANNIKGQREELMKMFHLLADYVVSQVN